MSAQIWFITGISSGFGLEIALKALQLGHKVIGTVRNRQRSKEQVDDFESRGGKIVELDVLDAPACFEVWNEALSIYGYIDVLVNNAGMSYLGALEDFTDAEVHAQMDVNVYGPFRLIRAALPGFRERKAGAIVNVTSIAGLDGLPSSGLYAASKFALEGLSEALAREVAEHNINVLIVEPGAFRTNFFSALKLNSKASITHYSAVKTMLDKFETWGGSQPGDPAKAAERIIEAVTGSGPAGQLKRKILRLPLGPDCVQRFEAKVKSMNEDLAASRGIAVGTDFDEK